MTTDGDLGYFGPKSVSWQVHREVTVLFGGARAVLMQAAHPLVIAGARETGFYERNPWKRLQRTLILTYTITFGTKAEAHAAADRINDVHTRIKGVDDVTGLPYDALDPELLLWVHACLVDSRAAVRGADRGQIERRGSTALPRGADAGGGDGEDPARDHPADGSGAPRVHGGRRSVAAICG